MEKINVLWDGEHCIFAVIVDGEKRFIYDDHYSSGSRNEYFNDVYDEYITGRMDKFTPYIGKAVEIDLFKFERKQ